jgi:integrase
MTGKVLADVEPAAMEVPRTTIREHAKVFVEKYKPGQKPSERREKRRVLDSHLLPVFGDMTIEELTQTMVDTFAQAELDRGMAVKTVNNRLAVLSTLIMPLPVLRDLMGHADIATTMRYIDVGEDDKRNAIAVVFGSSGVAATRQRRSTDRSPAALSN